MPRILFALTCLLFFSPLFADAKEDMTKGEKSDARVMAPKRVSPVQFKSILRASPPAKGEKKLAGHKPKLKGIHCTEGKYLPCWCEGADSCNGFIAVCAEAGKVPFCTDHDSEGKPTGCSCS